MRLENKVVWITGASSGIGEALAYNLSEKKCKLILSGRNIDALERVKNNCSNPNIHILAFDLENYENASANVTKALSFFGNIDILINNGGISQRSLIMDTEFKVDKKLIDIDYLGTIAITKALLPHFIAQKKGHYVTITSIMGKFGSPYRSGYCAAKHGLHGFFDVLRMEHFNDNISVTLVCPGFVQTNVAKNALTGNGSIQNTEDEATKNGIPVSKFAKKCVKAIESNKKEISIGGKEIIGVYIKRFFPSFLDKIILKNKVR